MSRRAVVFIDGNNWYHFLKGIHLSVPGDLDYAKISRKLIGSREWLETRYYIGRLPQQGSAKLYAEQRRFLARLIAQDHRITTHLGRLERRPIDDPAAKILATYLAQLKTRIDEEVYRDLVEIARSHRKATALVEKAVDVMIAVDMVVLSERDVFDVAYLLSADGDFTPAVQALRDHGKKVYVASPATGAQLASVANSYIPLRRAWFDDCYV